MGSAETFSNFVQPGRAVSFSEDHFASLSFTEAAELVLPSISSRRTLLSYRFSSETLHSWEASSVKSTETVPHLEDLIVLDSALPRAYAEGMRSVVVTFACEQIGTEVFHYHFSKIKLFRAVHKWHVPMLSASMVYHHLKLKQGSVNMSTALVYSDFLSQKIAMPIQGLLVTCFPLWKLVYLLDERYIEEDIVNALLELLYFRGTTTPSASNQTPINPPVPPSTLILPTEFYRDARIAYNDWPRIRTPQILEIQHRLRDTHAPSCLVTLWDIQLIDHRSVVEIIQWALSDSLTLPLAVGSGEIAKQALTGPSSGSCGLIAFKFLEQFLIQAEQWENVRAAEFRDAAMLELLFYHRLASQNHQVTVQDHVVRCIPESQRATNNGTGYNDFNVYTALNSHPIHLHVEAWAGFWASNQRAIRCVPTPVRTPLLGELKFTNLEDFDNAANPAPMLPQLTSSVPIQTSNESVSRRQARKIVPAVRKREESTPPRDVIVISDSSPLAPTVKRRYTRSPSLEIITPTKVKKEIHRQLPLVKVRSPSLELVIPHHGPGHSFVSGKKEEMTEETSERDEIRLLPSPVVVGSFYQTVDDARKAIFGQEEARRFIWITNQSKRNSKNEVIRITYRCRSSGVRVKSNEMTCDPADKRESKSIRTGCQAHVNVGRCDGGWVVTLADFTHNHSPHFPLGGRPVGRPTSEQKARVAALGTTVQKLNRSQISEIVRSEIEFKDKPLELRQISNIMNGARSQARADIQALGGDFPAILRELEAKKLEGWLFEAKVNDEGVVVALWWQSDVQSQLTKRYHDILLNDNTYNRNNAGYVLDIGVGIDGFCKSRNLWYALHEREDSATHSWVLQCHLKYAPTAPEVFGSDRAASLVRSVKDTMPQTFHMFCLQHLSGNIADNVRRHLGGQFPDFCNDFWAVYRAVSPEEFDRLWVALMSKYPKAQSYLDEEIYPCRQQWAWAYIMPRFTAGVRTNGRVEVENRVNKKISGPKSSLKQLFDALNERTAAQTTQDMERVRDSSRRQHGHAIESIFPGPLQLLRKYAGPFALHTCYEQMEASLSYTSSVVLLPDGIKTWDEYAIHVDEEVGFLWDHHEEQRMINMFTNDNSYIATRWLLRLINRSKNHVRHIFLVKRMGTNAKHYLAILDDHNYMCDCCMGLNLGIPCRHYFQVLLKTPALHFKIGHVRPRWYQDPHLDTTLIAPISVANYDAGQASRQASTAGTILDLVPSLTPARPNPSPVAPRATDTVDARTVHHILQEAVRPLSKNVYTWQDVDNLQDDITDLLRTRSNNETHSIIRDPVIERPKGRPRTQRLTAAKEGRPRGGGARAGRGGGRRCGICRRLGHNRQSCAFKESEFSQRGARDEDSERDGDGNSEYDDDDYEFLDSTAE